MRMRLDRYLADMGIGTRSEVRKQVGFGKVTVDGKCIRNPGFPVPEGASVMYRGEEIPYEPFVYYMLHKPSGVITATEDRRQKTVLDLITERTRRDLAPVGRLDKDTEGLLLITNDGALAHRLLSPKKHVDKIYTAIVRGQVTEEDIEAFAAGLQVDRELTALPAALRIVKPEDADDPYLMERFREECRSRGKAEAAAGEASRGETSDAGEVSGGAAGGIASDAGEVSGGAASDAGEMSGGMVSDVEEVSGETASDAEEVSGGAVSDAGEVSGGASGGIASDAGEVSGEALTIVEVTIREGKYHQIKRMFQAVGKEVIYLKRITLGPLRLDPSLPRGKYRRISESELEQLFSL